MIKYRIKRVRCQTMGTPTLSFFLSFNSSTLFFFSTYQTILRHINDDKYSSITHCFFFLSWKAINPSAHARTIDRIISFASLLVPLCDYNKSFDWPLTTMEISFFPSPHLTFTRRKFASIIAPRIRFQVSFAARWIRAADKTRGEEENNKIHGASQVFPSFANQPRENTGGDFVLCRVLAVG